MVTHFAAWPLNMYLSGTSFFKPENYMNVVCIAVIFVGFKFTHRAWQAAAGFAYAIILIGCILTIWSRPGHIDSPPQRDSAQKVEVAL